MWTYRPRIRSGPTSWQNAIAAATLLLLAATIFAAGYFCGPTTPSTPGG